MLVAQQAAAKEAENAARIFRFREANPRVGLAFKPDDRLAILANYLEECVPGFDRCLFELRWESWVSAKITEAEAKVEAYVEAHEQADREAELLDGVPLDPATVGAKLIVPGR